MISHVANTTSTIQGSTGQSPQLVELRKQESAAPVELPSQAVKSVESVGLDGVKKAAEQINKLVQQFDRNVQFSVDEGTGMHVVKVIDTATKDVIRQMPTQEMLAIAKALDKLQGLLIKEKA